MVKDLVIVDRLTRIFNLTDKVNDFNLVIVSLELKFASKNAMATLSINIVGEIFWTSIFDVEVIIAFTDRLIKPLSFTFGEIVVLWEQTLHSQVAIRVGE